MKVNDVFVLMGIIIVASFLGTTFFKRTRVPNPILLMGVGIALGAWHAKFDFVVLQQLAPFFGSLALLLILLEAGLDLTLSQFLQNFGRSLYFGLISFIVGMGGCYLVLSSWLGISQIEALILSSVGVGASPAILVPVLKSMDLSERTRTFFDLECTVTEVLGLIITVTLIPFILPAVDSYYIPIMNIISDAGRKLFQVGLLALVVPTLLGLVWSRLLALAGERPLWSVLTIGMALLLFGLSETGGGKGALNVLVFGMVIGNAPYIFKNLRRIVNKTVKSRPLRRVFLSFFIGQQHAGVHSVNREISFFVRTFFFVYLGVIVDFSKLGKQSILIAMILTFIPILTRLVLGRCSRPIIPAAQENLALFSVLNPRGLANAVAAFSVISAIEGLNLPQEQAEEWKSLIVAPVFGVILMSNAVLTFFLIVSKKSEGPPQSSLAG